MNIYLSSDHPGKVLETLEMAQYSPARHHIWNVPDHFDTVRVYIHRSTAKKSFFMAEGALLPSGVWKFEVEPGMLPDLGEAPYEIFGVENLGESERCEFLGGGLIRVAERNQDATPATVLEVPERVVIYDETGAAHYLRAVPDGMGNFTSIVE